MPRENVIQVPLNEKQIDLARKQADGDDVSLAAWAREQIFPSGLPLVRAFQVDSFAHARELVALARKKHPDQKHPEPEHVWDLLFRFKYSSRESTIAEVTDAECCHGRYSIDWEPRNHLREKGTRFVLAGSPWLHVLEEDFSSRLAAGSWKTVVRISVNHAENFYADEN